MIKEVKNHKKLFTTILIVVIITSMFIVPYTKNVKATWWDFDWDYKKEITIDHDQVAGDLNNFPVCINITDTGLRDYAQSDGDDIVFVDSTESTQFNHEIEYFDDSTGRLVAWVNITSLSSSVDTTIYMYYGNSEASNQEDVDNTWHSVYYAVYHMEMDESDNLIDSSGNSNDAVGFNTPVESEETTKFGYVVTLIDENGPEDHDADFFLMPNVSFENDFSVTGKFYESTLDEDYHELLCLHYGTRHNVMRVYDGNFASWYYDGTGHTTTYGSENTNENVFSYVFEEGGNYPHFLNGVKTNIPSNTGQTGSSALSNRIGCDVSGNWGWKGKIDELRITIDVRSDNWIHTEHNSFLNATDGGFFTLGVEELSSNSSTSTLTLPNNKFTLQGETGNTTYSNESATIYETGNFSFMYNGSQTIDYVRINVSDIHANITSDFVYLQFTSDNSSWSKGGNWKTGASGGWSFILNDTTFTEANSCYGSDPFPINDSASYVYWRVKVIIPEAIGNETYSNTAMTWDYGYYD